MNMMDSLRDVLLTILSLDDDILKLMEMF